MDINKCPNCQKQFDQDKRVSKQLPCGCVSCLKCYKIIFQHTQKIECVKHQQVFIMNPEELQDYVMQKQVPQQIHQEKFVDQVQINECFRWLQGQYVQKQNYYLKLREVFQDSVEFMKHIQQLSKHLIFKALIEQFSISNERVKNSLKRLSEFQAINEGYQQQYDQRVGWQDPQLRQNCQGQQKQQFQQILSEIEELKKDQWMDEQSLRVNVQRCMLNLFVYLSESSSGHLLTEKKAELLIKKYFEQNKVQNSLSQVPNSLVQLSSFKSQSNQQQLSQGSWDSNQQQQNQLFDNQQGQDIVQTKQLLIQNEISLQEGQVIDARVSFQQLEQKLLNLKNEISVTNQEHYLCEEQSMILKYEIQDFVGITFGKLVQFLSQIKEEKVSKQVLQVSPLNKSGLTEYPQVLLQLLQVTDQQICLKLSEIIQICQAQQGVAQAESNALTILNGINYNFNQLNFQNLDLSSSDLSDITFTSCNFSNSNLTQANLRNTKFINCDLSNANLTSIITEYPHIFTGHTYSVFAVAISSDSQFIVSGSQDSTIILWDIKTGTSKTMSGHTGSVYAVAISRDSEFIVSGSYRTIILWEVKTGTSKTMSGHTRYVNAVAISRDSEFIVSGSRDSTIILWDIKTGTSKTMSGHTNCVSAVAISRDSEFIVSGADKTVRLWSTKTLECIKVLSDHTHYVTSVSISNDSQYIISGSGDSTIRLWSTKSQECIKVFSGHSSYVSSVIFSFDSKYIISGSEDKTIRVWSVQSGQQLCVLSGLPGHIRRLILSRDGNWLLSSKKYYSAQSGDYNIRRWNIGRMLNVSEQNVGEQNQVKMDWTSIYGDYGLGFKDCVVSNIVMSVQDRERYIK